MMINCWKYSPRQRPTFVQIIEELVPDLDPSFHEDSFFFSDLNTALEEEDEDGMFRLVQNSVFSLGLT